MGQVLRVDELRKRTPRNGYAARPNVYRRSEAREMTNAYLAEVERKAAGVDEPVPYQLKLKVWHVAAATLAAVGIAVGMWAY